MPFLLEWRELQMHGQTGVQVSRRDAVVSSRICGTETAGEAARYGSLGAGEQGRRRER